MSVHYKFKSAVEYDTLPVDGLNISLGDLKEAIIQQKRLGKGQPYDLQITNAETKEVYADEKILIPKNSSLIVARVPIDASQMKRPWENKEATALILANPSNLMNTEDAAEAAEIDRKIKEVTDLTRMEGSEQDKINAMVAQSTMEYHPSRYVKLRASKMTGVVPVGYRCYKCNKAGHWVTMCPLNNQDLRKSTGIPSMFLEEVKDPSAPGVMINATGKLVRLREMADDKKSGMIPPTDRYLPPEELECQLCKEILKDAVLIPCCAAAFCDECIRNNLLDSEDHACPACDEDGIGPDTLIPNRYLRIKVQQFECGWYPSERRTDGSSDVGEPLSSVPEHLVQARITPTPPHSPANSSSPARIRVADIIKSPSSAAGGSPVPEKTPPRINVVEPVGNGEVEPDESIVPEEKEVRNEIRDASSEHEFMAPEEPLEPEDMQPNVEEKENIELNEADTSVDEKLKKIKKKKGKRKNSRHESEEEREEKKRKKKERSQKSQDKKAANLEKKSKRHGAEMVKDVADLPEIKSELWDDANVDVKIPHEKDEVEEKKKKKSRSKDVLKDVDDDEEKWSGERIEESSQNRSRSSSGDKENDTVTLFDNVVPFNPHVPPPNFVKSPPQGYQYPVTSTYLHQAPPPVAVPVTTDPAYPHYQPGIPPPILANPSLSYARTHGRTHSTYSERELIADPLTEFEKHMRKKDERDRRWRYSRSRSPSRSPRFRRVRSRSRQRSWSRSRTRSLSRPRVGVSTRSPRSQSRRRWSRTPPPRGHAYRSRSPSFPREHSLSNRSLSLSRTPSPSTSRRVGSSPLQVHPVHPDPHGLARPPPPVDYGVPRDYNRFPVGSLPHEQYQHQPPFHPSSTHWDQHTRYNQGRPENMKPNFRGRRGRGGFRQGENFDHRGQDFRHQDYRPQRMLEERRGGPPGAAGWEGRQTFNTEIPRNDRGNNRHHFDGERRRYPDSVEFDEIRPRRHDEALPQNNIYSDEEEWRRYSDDGRKREEDPDRRRYEGRRGRDDRKDDLELRKASDVDEFEEYKRTRKDGDGSGVKSFERVYKDVDDGRPGRHEREGKHRGMPRRDSPREEEILFRGKSYDSPGKSHKKSPPKDRREKEGDRRDREVDRRERDVDRRDKDADKSDRERDRRDRDSARRDREPDKRDREVDRRVKEVDRRERDDRRDRDVDNKQESDRKEKDYDRKDSYKREKDQDRKVREGDRKDKDGDRRERETSKRDKDSSNKDKGDRNIDDDKRDRLYVSRWDHVDTKHRSDKEIEKNGKSQDRERSLGKEEKEHKRKSKRREEKDEGHHTKDKGDGAPDSENPTKAEKKKHDKKKKKKEKRRASQASTEASQGEVSGDEGEDKKKKKKREKKRKAKGIAVEEGSEEMVDDKAPLNDEKVAGGDLVDSVDAAVLETKVQNDSEIASRERTPEPKPSDESPSALLPLPPLSKWERDEELTLTPKGLSENKAPEEEKKVTVDILKRAENTIFAGRGLATRKVFLDPQKQKEVEEKERSPTPEWDRMELREAKRRGPSIQITISSKTESQIGRPRGGRYQPSSPEHLEEKRYTLRSRRGADSDSKSEKHSRSQKRSQSPSESQSTVKTRRKSEREHSRDEKNSDVHTDRSDMNSESFNSEKKSKVDDTDKDKLPVKDVGKEDAETDNEPDNLHELDVPKSGLKPCNDVQDTKHGFLDDTVKEENGSKKKGVKRPSSSSDELEVKKLKTEDEPSTIACGITENINRAETVANADDKESVAPKGEQEYDIPELDESSVKDVKNSKHMALNVPNRNLVAVPLAPGEGEELEEGEIPSDSSGEGDNDDVPEETVVETPLELRGVVQSETTEESPLKASHKIRYSPIRVPSPGQQGVSKETRKVKEKTKKRKKRKRSSSSSSSNSSSSSSSSSSSEDEEIVKKKKKKKKKKKAVLSESSDGESQRKHKKKKKDKKKKKKKGKKKSDK